MVVLALLMVAVVLLALLVTTRRARDAARAALETIAITRREMRPALVHARDDVRRAERMHLPDRR